MKIVNERRVSRHIYHVVDQIVAPWGTGVEERPRVLTREEREERYRSKRARKEARRGAREVVGEMVGEVEGLSEGAKVVVEKAMREVEGGR